MSGRHRDVGRKYLSGNSKRKLQEEKSKKDQLVVSKTQKLTSFFTISAELRKYTPTQTETHEDQDSDNDFDSADDHTVGENNVDSSEAETDLNPSDSVVEDRLESAISNQQLNTACASDPFSTDVGSWPLDLDEDAQEYWIAAGSKTCQHSAADFSSSQRHYDCDSAKRSCQKWFFVHTHKKTKEKSNRSWLCYSESKGKLFCFTCKLLNATSSRFTQEGFGDWKNAHSCLQQHERSAEHRSAVITFINRHCQKNCVDEKSCGGSKVNF